jgi:hypothetical protein
MSSGQLSRPGEREEYLMKACFLAASGKLGQ